MAVAGDHAYLAAGDQGIFVVDVADPQSIQVVGQHDTPRDAGQLIVAGSYVLVADREGGVAVFSSSLLPQPERPVAPVIPTAGGVSNRSTYSVKGSKLPESRLTLYDTSQVLDERYREGTSFDFAADLAPGVHLLTGVATSYGVSSRRSAPRRLTVARELPWDPIGGTLSYCAADRSLLPTRPIGYDGCIDPTDGSVVRPILGREFELAVPVRDSVRGVTVTLGSKNQALVRSLGGTFNGRMGPLEAADWAADGGGFTLGLAVGGDTIEVPGRTLWSRAFIPCAIQQ